MLKNVRNVYSNNKYLRNELPDLSFHDGCNNNLPSFDILLFISCCLPHFLNDFRHFHMLSMQESRVKTEKGLENRHLSKHFYL